MIAVCVCVCVYFCLCGYRCLLKSNKCQRLEAHFTHPECVGYGVVLISLFWLCDFLSFDLGVVPLHPGASVSSSVKWEHHPPRAGSLLCSLFPDFAFTCALLLPIYSSFIIQADLLNCELDHVTHVTTLQWLPVTSMCNVQGVCRAFRPVVLACLSHWPSHCSFFHWWLLPLEFPSGPPWAEAFSPARVLYAPLDWTRVALLPVLVSFCTILH